MHPELLNNPTFLRYNEAWQRDPKSLVFAPLADFFCQHKLYADARKVCEAGVKHNPNSVLAHYSLAKAYLYTREWHSARHEAQWVLARSSNHQGALNVLHQVEQHQVPVRHMVVQPKAVPAILSPDLVRVEELTQEHAVQNNRLAEVMAAAGGSSSPMAVEEEEKIVAPEAPFMMRRVVGRVAPGIPTPAAPAVQATPTVQATQPIPATPKMAPTARPQKLLPWQTVTMAKIYSQQGLFYKARTIYKTILSRDPQNTEAQAGLATLERMIRDAAA